MPARRGGRPADGRRVRLRRADQGAAAVRARDPERPPVAAPALARARRRSSARSWPATSSTGVSIMRLTAGLDSGPVCLAASEAIRPEDTYGSLAPRLAELGGELLRARARRRRRRSSSRPSRASPTRRRSVRPTACSIRRGPRPSSSASCGPCHPHIGARVALADGTLLGVHRAALLEARRPAATPIRRPGPRGGLAGGVMAGDGRLLLACAPGRARAARGAAAGRARDGRRRLPARSRTARDAGSRSRSPAAAIPAAAADRARAHRGRAGQRDHARPRRPARSPPRRPPAGPCGPWPRPRRSRSRAPRWP